ncbi:PLP-dependent aminotransferase family protein [Sphingopyxis panaciterrulae]|uniref:2-aminoadipate transaminase n=1 Tax=Sphingopyxis panaciterrulae TaxID=462372 RepID=A0A7W9B882_9SPHN|nr:PLP-dependent aminotransferase family protein [Sphingopyxis panaciterrulae]MBB5708040.1 2-aminoadipate transaminase [Sphingopyxis panaciterrulae]
MSDDRLARRARPLSTRLPSPHFPSEFGEEVILFDSGFAAPQLLPDLAPYAAVALTEHRDETLQYASGRGQPYLRAWLAEWMNADGCDVTADHILVTNGAKQGIDLVCRLLLDEGDAIVVTAPTYFTAIPIFRNFGVEFIEVGQDAAGLDVAALDALLARRDAEGKPPPKFIYNIPEFHNPTGATMTGARRTALVALAEAREIPILEDSPYRRVRFDGEDQPLLKALDRSGIVFHLGTFSKLVAPGLRIGWIVAEPALIARLIQLKSEGGSSPLIQRIIHDFANSSAFPDHIAKVQREYRVRRDCILAAVGRDLPEARIAIPGGGYYVWLTLPDRVDGDLLAARAADAGVHLIAGSRFFAGSSDDAPRHHVRLSFSYATPHQIEDGIRRLGAVYRTIAC